jgi:hypothetical protein
MGLSNDTDSSAYMHALSDNVYTHNQTYVIESGTGTGTGTGSF